MESPLSPPRDEVLVFGSAPLIETCGAVLGVHYRVATSSSVDAALTALRMQSELVLDKLSLQRAKSDHLLQRGELARQGTNVQWPNSVCPQRGHRGVTSFDFISHRRSWYACPECKKVWIGRRQEEF